MVLLLIVVGLHIVSAQKWCEIRVNDGRKNAEIQNYLRVNNLRMNSLADNSLSAHSLRAQNTHHDARSPISFPDLPRIIENQGSYLACLEEYLTPLPFQRVDYLKYLPYCIENVGLPSQTGCDMKELIDKGYPIQSIATMQSFFCCMNQYNRGHHIQQRTANVILWTGQQGNEKALQLAKESQKQLAVQLAKNHEGWVPFNKNLFDFDHYWTDTLISTLNIVFDQGYQRINNWRERQVYFDIVCMWLVFNAKFPVTMYGGINWQFVEPKKTNYNDGNKELAEAGITQALVMGSYFWNTEMIVLTRLVSDTTLEMHRRVAGIPVTSVQIDVRLMIYEIGDDVNAKPPAHPTGKWTDPVNIFGDLEEIKNIPVAYREGYSIYPVDVDLLNQNLPDNLKIENDTKVTLYHIVQAFNHKGGGNIKKLGENMQDMIDFVDWVGDKKHGFAKAYQPKSKE